MFTKKLFISLVLLVGLIILSSPAIFAQVYVATGGDDAFGTGAVGNPYRSITKAISVAATGSTIYIEAGIYNSAVIPTEANPITLAANKNLTFVGNATSAFTSVTLTNGFVLNSASAVVNFGASGTATFNFASLTLTAGTMNITVPSNVVIADGGLLTISDGVLNGVPTKGSNLNVTLNGANAISATSGFLPSALGSSGTLTVSKASGDVTIDNTALSVGAFVTNNAANVNIPNGLTVAANGDITNSSTGTLTIGTTSANTLTMSSTTALGQIVVSGGGAVVVNAAVVYNVKNANDGTNNTGTDVSRVPGNVFDVSSASSLTINGNLTFNNTNVAAQNGTNAVSHTVTLSNSSTGTLAINGNITTPLSAVVFSAPTGGNNNAFVNVMLSNTGAGALNVKNAALRGAAGTTGVTNNGAGLMTLGGTSGDVFTTDYDVVQDYLAAVTTVSRLVINASSTFGGAVNNNATVAGAIVTFNANATIKGILTNASKMVLGTSTITISKSVAGALNNSGDIYSVTSAHTGSGLLKFTGDSPTITGTGNLPNVEFNSKTSPQITNGNTIWGNLNVTKANTALTIAGATVVQGDVNMTAGNITLGADLTIVGTFNIPQGTFSFGVAHTLNLKGNFNRTGGIIDQAAAGTGTLNFNGTTSQTFNAGVQMNVYNVTVNNTGQYLAGVIADDIVTVNGALIVLKDFSILGTKGLVNLGTSNIRMEQAAPAKSARFTNGGRGYSASGIGGIIFEGDGSNVIGGTPGDGSVLTGTNAFSNIYVRLSTPANNVWCIGAVSVSGVITLDAGGITWNNTDDGTDGFSFATSGSLLTLSNTLVTPTVVINTSNTHGSPFLVDGLGGQALAYNDIATVYNLIYSGFPVGGTITMSAADFATARVNNLSIQAGSSAKTVQIFTANATIKGDLNVDAGETLDLLNGVARTLTASSNTGAHTVNGTIAGAGSTFEITGTGATLTGGSGTGNASAIAGTLLVDPATGGTFTSTGMKLLGALTINQASLVSSITMNAATATVNAFTNSNGTTTLNMNSTVVTATGSYAVAAGNVTLTMGGTAATRTIATNLSVTGGSLTLGSSVDVSGNVTHNGSSSIILGSNNLTIVGAYTHDNLATFTGAGAVIAATAVPQNYTFTTTVTIPNLIVNSPSTISVVSNGFTVSNSFRLQAGTIALAALPLTITANSIRYDAGAITATAGTGLVSLQGTAPVVTSYAAGNFAIPYLEVNTTGTVSFMTSDLTTPTARVFEVANGFTHTQGNIQLNINDLKLTGTAAYTTAAANTGTVTGVATGADIGEVVFSGGAHSVTLGANYSIQNVNVASATSRTDTKVLTVGSNLTLAANLTSGASAYLVLGDGATITRTAGVFDVAPTFGATVNVVYNPGGALNTDVELPTGTLVLNDLTITTAGTAVVLKANAQVNGTLFLAGGTISTGTKTLTIATGASINRSAGAFAGATTDVPTVTTYNLIYSGSTTIAGIGTEFVDSPIAVSSLTVSMKNNGVTLDANRTVGSFTMSPTGNNAATVYFSLGTGTVPRTLTVLGLTTFTNGIIETIPAGSGGTLVVDGDVNASGGTFGTTIQMSFLGATNQTITAPAGGATIGNITINKTGGTVTLAGGDLTCGGVVTFNNGLVMTGADNALVLTNSAGASTGKGYVRALVTGGKSHVVGNVKQNLQHAALIAFARNEFPVGDTANYRPVALTFLTSSGPGNFGIFATVSHTNTRPTGTAGLPIADAIATGTPINGYPSFYWTIKTDGSMGATAFNLDLTGAGALASEVNLADVGANRVKIIRRGGSASDVANIWNLQGTRESYDNLVVSNVPTVIAVNAVGGLSTAGAIFTYGYAGATTGSKVSGTLTYANPTASGIGNATVTLTPAAGAAMTTTSSTTGAYAFTNVPAGTYTVAASKTGTWGGVTGGDALLVARHAAGIALVTGLPLAVADVNSSSSVTAADALLIVRRAVGLDASFVAGDWKFSSQSVAVSTSDTVVNLNGLCVGDVNASYVPAVGTVFAKTASVSLENGATNFGVSTSSAMTLGSATIRISAKSATIAEVTSKLPGFVSRITESGLMFSWFAADGNTAVKFNANEPLISVKLEGKATEGSSVTVETELTDINGAAMNNELAMAVKEIPSVFALAQNYPNPFNPSTTINYSLPQSGMVSLTIYNVMGQEVAKLVNEQMNAGSYSVEWAPRNMASGMYIYRINVQTEKEVFTSSKRLMLLK